ncbi:hypothetical protein AMAG_17811 [Allomyces macrogynus ATCC 38327]|uniref:NrS-1 polymerase-like helicase domain-containing protein n=1 Tax=Allomyces macrogynus (strain ATCC 38327) TaxID=578462 RepID=A0A0L0RZ60_ALLM3|nr:hypothetical protein AMAG_17811 [Allomyces macrogynus ATCC 38327]|eukprot:KNE55707.1 hypothetical protein AMAG_17811 [Allomyces macrogynus ATCC 38327]
MENATSTQLKAFMDRLDKAPFDDTRRIVLHEFVNMEVLKDLSKKHSGVHQDLKKKLRAYLTLLQSTYGEGKETVYCFPKDRRGNKEFGRLYATSVSLQSLKKDSRGALAAGVLQDIDMVAAAPSIFKGILAHYDLQSKALDTYLEDRQQALTKYKLKEKSDFLAIMFSEHLYTTLHPELMEMHHLLYTVAYPRLSADYPNILQASKTRTMTTINKGSFMSNVFQAVESLVLMEAVEFFRARDLVPSVLCFDGLMVVKDDKVNEELLEELHQYTVQQTGFDIKWAEKELKKDANLEKRDFPESCENVDEFVKAKLEENTHYDEEWVRKVLNHMKRCKEADDADSWEQVVSTYVGEFLRKDLTVGMFYFRACVDDDWGLNVSHGTVDMVASIGQDFAPIVKKRIFDFYKPQWGPCSGKKYIDYFNAFPGFAATNLKQTIPRDEVSMYLDYILEVICSGRETEYKFVLKWLQELFTSGTANGVVLALTGLEGVGKGFLFESISTYMLGKKLCVPLNNAAQFLAGSFNSEIENKSLVLFDEMPVSNGRERMAAFDRLKNMVTDTRTIINEKCVRRYEVKNVNNFMIASNNKNILPLTKSGRRVFVLNVSNKRRCDCMYFRHLDEYVKANADKIFTYLCNVDLSDIDLANFPWNEDRDAIVEASADPISALFQEITEYGGFPRNLMEQNREVEVEQSMSSTELYETYQKFVQKRFPGHHVISMTAFGVHLRDAIDLQRGGDARLFMKQRVRVNGHREVMWVYLGPGAMDLSDDEE